MKKVIMGCAAALTVFLSGCSFGTSIENQLSDTVIELNQIESKYKDVQSTLHDLEQKEQKLFNETMELTKEQRVELTAKVAELEDLLAQRLEHIEKEQSAIEKAKKSVSDFDAIIANADENDKKLIEELKSVVTSRYELHSLFVEEYKELATYQKELYEMLITENTEIIELKEQVKKVNAQNEVVQTAIDTFNKATVDVNELKDEVISGLQDHN